MISVTQADLHNPDDGQAILTLLDEYARDPMGGGAPVDPAVRARLIDELAKRPTARVLIARDEAGPAGLAITFEGFSTFAGKPLLNLHDFMVSARCRGQGVGLRLLAALDELARSLGCCKLTLEVLEGNEAARRLYRKAGYEGYALQAEHGQAHFWQKKLEA
ncbi:GNAT family N-acetyltransferase [Bordetella trematum]|uniref:GNAT family N-acetyltransferase n=1 Tax=Bordetella trematum TaxID=123899 RepID=UPI000C78AD00|nr:GNAT family N-acetyltransferase [Bordetella trematum]AUL46388.1 GNAT family N-acetyltransferase [Bordetella trematum]